MQEEELFEPIKQYFEQEGYTIDGEVNDVDMVGVKEQEAIAIELKNDLNLRLITQTALRQKSFLKVYAAIWMPKNLRNRRFQEKCYLLKRLGIGLLLVSKRQGKVFLNHPASEQMDSVLKPYRQRNRKKQENLLREFRGRRIKKNTGGTFQKKIISAYKEDALIILHVLLKNGPMSPKNIKGITNINRSRDVVYRNYYMWFYRIKRGLYGVTEVGKEAYDKNHSLILQLINKDPHISDRIDKE